MYFFYGGRTYVIKILDISKIQEPNSCPVEIVLEENISNDQGSAPQRLIENKTRFDRNFFAEDGCLRISTLSIWSGQFSTLNNSPMKIKLGDL